MDLKIDRWGHEKAILRWNYDHQPWACAFFIFFHPESDKTHMAIVVNPHSKVTAARPTRYPPALPDFCLRASVIDQLGKPYSAPWAQWPSPPERSLSERRSEICIFASIRCEKCPGWERHSDSSWQPFQVNTVFWIHVNFEVLFRPLHIK